MCVCVRESTSDWKQKLIIRKESNKQCHGLLQPILLIFFLPKQIKWKTELIPNVETVSSKHSVKLHMLCIYVYECQKIDDPWLRETSSQRPANSTQTEKVDILLSKSFTTILLY